MTVPVEGTWEGGARAPRGRNGVAVPLRPTVVDRRELDGGGVAVPLRAVPRWAPVLLLAVGTALVGVLVAAVVSSVTRPVRAGAPVGLVVLALFGLLGVTLLAAVPATVRASRPGRRWLLTPAALVTTSVTVPWDAIGSVQRQTLVWSTRLRRRHQHVLAVGLRPGVDPGELPGVAESRLATALLARSSRKVVALGDTRYLGVDPERLATAIALLAARPDLRERLRDARGVRLVETGTSEPEGTAAATGSGD